MALPKVGPILKTLFPYGSCCVSGGLAHWLRSLLTLAFLVPRAWGRSGECASKAQWQKLASHGLEQRSNMLFLSLELTQFSPWYSLGEVRAGCRSWEVRQCLSAHGPSFLSSAEQLLVGLKDKDTVVRWSAAKG